MLPKKELENQQVKKPLRTQAGPRRGGPGMHIGMPTEKAKDFKGTVRRLFKFLKPYTAQLLIISLFTIFTIAVMVAGPFIVRNIMNDIQQYVTGIISKTTLIDNTVKYFSVLLALYAIRFLVEATSHVLGNKVSISLGRNLRNTLRQKLERLPIKYFDEEQTGNILSVFSNDVDTVINSIQQSLMQMISSFFTIIGVLIMMFIISWQLTLIALVTLPIYILSTKAIAKRSQSKFIKRQRFLGSLNGNIEETFSGNVAVKLYGKEDDSYEAFQVINEKLTQESKSAQFLSGLIRPILEFISNIGYVAVVFVGGILAGGANPLLIGDITSFISYQKSFVNPILNLASIVNQLQSTVAGAERIFDLMDQVEEVAELDVSNFDGKEFSGHVVFKDIHFSYKEDQELIKDLNLEVFPGRQIAIVGPTGAGKTTLVNLLMRFYEVNQGSILIDGKNSTDVTRTNLRGLFGMVLQDTWLFAGTIKDNVKYGKRDASDEEVIKACKQAHVHHFIETLPEGYDTILNEDAANISQGQKQLLTIARAILCDPRILILDEATSSVDTRTESYIQNAMDFMMEGKTSFVIAHRLSTIKKAHLILVMNHGSIVEQGTHNELLAKNGVYADLYNAQFLNQAT
ncbi:MAG: ABC transporter ATP-binding protein [Tenericutes bacterium]|nr:ABC transporter ATP-binding protein [Mycoplasmatota bacterium]